jgi:hypothetical protein
MTQNCSIRRPLREIACPICGDMLQAQLGDPIAAANWLDCLRRCLKCEVGISNARDNPTIIFNNPLLNVPMEVHGGLLDTLSLSLNVRNRANKRTKFGFSTSEDALTWTVFKFLSDHGQLTNVLRTAGLPIPEAVSRHEAMLLWGVPMPLDRKSNVNGWELRQSLEIISTGLGEDPNSSTEPDVLIDFGPHGVFIIEVKHRSETSLKDVGYAGWDKYFPANSPLPYAAAMRASECYELARNWRFGLELIATTNRPFTLAYLGPSSLFEGIAESVLQPFEDCLPAEGLASFHRIGWNALLGAITDPPPWLIQQFATEGYAVEEGD